VEAVRPAEGTELRVNQRAPLHDLLGPDAEEAPAEILRCRPDLVIVDRNKKTIRIVDVTVPYEDGWQAIQAARENKLHIYSPLSQFLRAKGYSTSVDAFVVGALGTWDNANWGSLSRLGVSRRYATTLARSCVSVSKIKM
jgi:hypothetical protein